MRALRSVDKRLWYIVALAAVFIFFRIAHADMTGDDAHYSVRAIGLADFMFGDDSFQSTPVHWYKTTVPWWTHLSFHDHPIFLFLIQHAFLSLHTSIFFAKLPYALFGLASIVCIYAVGKRLYGNTAGLVAALLLALNAHVIWASRVSYMESGVIFFILLALYGYVRFVEQEKWWWLFGLLFGLALSVKFTTLFLVPAFLAALVVNRKSVFLKKELYESLSIAFIVVSPILFYNLFMYNARGHFSVQFARLLGQQHPWRFGGVTSSGYGHALRVIGESLGALVSWPLLALFAAAFLFALARWRKHAIILSGVFFLTIQQMFIGQGGYVLAPYGIFIALLTAAFLVSAYEWIREHASVMAHPALFAGAAFSLYLVFFVANSHSFGRHFGAVGFLKSQATTDNYGVLQLDRHIEKMLHGAVRIDDAYDIFQRVKARDPHLYRYMTPVPMAEQVEQRTHANVVLYDNNLNWFSRVWLFERRRFYENLAFVSLAERHVLDAIDIRNFYFIKATEAAPLDAVDNRTDESARLELFVANLGVTPELIYRDDGQVAFKVYFVDTKKLNVSI